MITEQASRTIVRLRSQRFAVRLIEPSQICKVCSSSAVGLIHVGKVRPRTLINFFLLFIHRSAHNLYPVLPLTIIHIAPSCCSGSTMHDQCLIQPSRVSSVFALLSESAAISHCLFILSEVVANDGSIELQWNACETI